WRPAAGPGGGCPCGYGRYSCLTSRQLVQPFAEALVQIHQALGGNLRVVFLDDDVALAEEGHYQCGNHPLGFRLGGQVAIALENVVTQLLAQDGHHLVLEHAGKILWAIPVGCTCFQMSGMNSQTAMISSTHP